MEDASEWPVVVTPRLGGKRIRGTSPSPDLKHTIRRDVVLHLVVVVNLVVLAVQRPAAYKEDVCPVGAVDHVASQHVWWPIPITRE